MKVMVFGCSLTRFNWPTWADIILEQAKKFDFETENWGQPGIGNFYIAMHVQEAIARKLIKPGDHVIICWTSMLREDRYLPGDSQRWLAAGNVFSEHSLNQIHTRDWVDKFVNLNFNLYRDLTLIQSTQRTLESMGVVYSHFKSNDFKEVELANPSNRNLIKTLTQTFNIKFDYPELMPFLIRQERVKINPIPTQFQIKGKTVNDVHPQPNHYLLYASKCLTHNKKHHWLHELDSNVSNWAKAQQELVEQAVQPLTYDSHPLPSFNNAPWQLSSELFQ